MAICQRNLMTLKSSNKITEVCTSHVILILFFSTFIFILYKGRYPWKIGSKTKWSKQKFLTKIMWEALLHKKRYCLQTAFHFWVTSWAPKILDLGQWEFSSISLRYQIPHLVILKSQLPGQSGYLDYFIYKTFYQLPFMPKDCAI